MDNIKHTKITKQYSCDLCNFITKRKGDYNRHLSTLKHQCIVNGNSKDIKTFICNCGNEYTNRHSLSRHKTKCNFKPKQEVIQEPVKFEPTMSMFMELIKENQEIKNLLIEQNKQMQEQNKQIQEQCKQNTELVNKFVEKDFVTNNTTNNNSNNTTNNNKFNLNFFLNETCKTGNLRFPCHPSLFFHKNFINNI